MDSRATAFKRALALPLSADLSAAAAELGNGSKVMASHTVLFSLWCAARHLDDLEQAL